MTTTTTVYPDSDLDGPWRRTAPLSVDGSAYTRPTIIGIDTVGYLGGDSNAPGEVPSALVLPTLDGVSSSSGTVELMVAEGWPDAAKHSGSFYVPGSTSTLDIPSTDRFGDPFTVAAGDLIEVIVWTQSPASSAPGAPTCSGLSLSWTERGHLPCSVDYRPEFTKFYALATGGETGTITLDHGTTNITRDCQLRIYRGVDQASPYEIDTWTTGQIVVGYSYPNAPSLTVSTDGALVTVTAGGDTTGSGYATPTGPSGYTQVINTATSNPNVRTPNVMAIQEDAAPGAWNPPAMGGLDFSNEFAEIDAITPGSSTEIPLLVVVAGVDETETGTLATGDVALSAANEVQLLEAFASSGSRTLTFGGQTTASIADTASAATVQSALEALSNIAPGDVIVTGGPLNTAPIRIEFAATYAQTNVGQISVSGSNTDPVNEVQSIQSDRTSGTFTLTFGGQTTAAIPVTAAASQVEAALQALSSIGEGNVQCTGGPLPGSAILIEFVGDLAGADQATITRTDNGSGGTGLSVSGVTDGVAGAGMVVTTAVIGSTGEDLTLEAAYNVPRGASGQPQAHAFVLTTTDYQAGQGLDVTSSDHDGNRSYAAVLLVFDPASVDTADLIEAASAVTVAASGTTASFASITPATSGAIVLEFLAKARASGYYSGTPTGGSIPAGAERIALAVADLMTLDVFASPPVAAAAMTPGSSAWSGGAEGWLTVSLALAPAVGASAGSDLYVVVDDDGTDDYLEISSAAGQMYEVLELDMSSVPTDAVVTGARVLVSHQSAVPNQLRVTLVGINDDDSIQAAQEQQVGYTPDAGDVLTEIETGLWTELADGSLLSEYDRLGVALISTSRHPSLASHRITSVRAQVRYEEGGPVTTNAAQSGAPGAAITWDYAGSFPQSAFEVRVIQGAGQDPETATAPADPLDPSTGEIVYDSGLVYGSVDRALSITDGPWSRGSVTIAVRSWALITSSLEVASDWSTADVDLTGTPTATPDQSGNAVSFDPTTAGVDVTVTAPAGATRAWLERSTDGGSTWSLVEGGPFEVTESTDNDLTDVYAPGAASVLYAVSFDEGPMTETGAPDQVGSGAVSTTPVHNVLACPSDPSLTTVIDLMARAERDPLESFVASQAGGALVATSDELPRTFRMTVRCLDEGQRLALSAILEARTTMRFVDILGRSWLVRRPSAREVQMLRLMPTSAESTALRDAHEVSFDLVEVAS